MPELAVRIYMEMFDLSYEEAWKDMSETTVSDADDDSDTGFL